jgi:hypothetical protein
MHYITLVTVLAKDGVDCVPSRTSEERSPLQTTRHLLGVQYHVATLQPYVSN